MMCCVQVETIGDAYMVAAGLLDTHVKHAEAVTNMAFGMMQEAGKVMEPTNKTPIQVQIFKCQLSEYAWPVHLESLSAQ